MEKKTKKVVASMLALAVLVVFSLMGYAGSLEPPAAPAPTMKTLNEVEPRVPIHASDLPLTITEPNSYYLVEDVNFTDDANHAITIECNDVTIDLMGYALKGPDSGNNSGIYMNGRTNVEVRNGTIRDFGSPAIYESTTNGSSHRVVNIRTLSNGHGIFLAGVGHLIKDCTTAENGSYGIYAEFGSTVTGNTVRDNDGYGIFAGYGSTVTGNTVRDNDGYGIDTGSGSTVNGNTVRDNDGYGINTGSGSTVTGNTVRQNGNYGIYTGDSCTVTGNTARDNGANGIWALGGSMVTGNTAYYNGALGIFTDVGSTVTGNTACGNSAHGIFADTGCTVTGNTAYLNNTSNNVNGAGIYVSYGCLVKGNTAKGNLQNNIYVAGGDNAIEENLVTMCSPGNGIYFGGDGNFYDNNRASGNAKDYNDLDFAGQTDGGGNVSF